MYYYFLFLPEETIRLTCQFLKSFKHTTSKVRKSKIINKILLLFLHDDKRKRTKWMDGWGQFPFVIIRFLGSMHTYACYNRKEEK